MTFMVGTVECKCYNIMGMPTDTGKCTIEGCDATKTFYGNNTYSELTDWAKTHTQEAHGSETASRESAQTTK